MQISFSVYVYLSFQILFKCILYLRLIKLQVLAKVQSIFYSSILIFYNTNQTIIPKFMMYPPQTQSQHLERSVFLNAMIDFLKSENLIDGIKQLVFYISLSISQEQLNKITTKGQDLMVIYFQSGFQDDLKQPVSINRIIVQRFIKSKRHIDSIKATWKIYLASLARCSIWPTHYIKIRKYHSKKRVCSKLPPLTCRVDYCQKHSTNNSLLSLSQRRYRTHFDLRSDESSAQSEQNDTYQEHKQSFDQSSDSSPKKRQNIIAQKNQLKVYNIEIPPKNIQKISDNPDRI